MGRKVRVNITVDEEMLKKAKAKLHLFGGKLSTLFNAYLSDFVSSLDKKFGEDNKIMQDKINEVEQRLARLEKHMNRLNKNI